MAKDTAQQNVNLCLYDEASKWIDADLLTAAIFGDHKAVATVAGRAVAEWKRTESLNRKGKQAVGRGEAMSPITIKALAWKLNVICTKDEMVPPEELNELLKLCLGLERYKAKKAVGKRFIAALYFASAPYLTAAYVAERCYTSEKNISTWLRDPQFQKKIELYNGGRPLPSKSHR